MENKEKRVLFGTGYQYDSNMTQEENWKAMQTYYAKQGLVINDMSKEDNEEMEKLIEEMKPDLDKIIKNKKRLKVPNG